MSPINIRQGGMGDLDQIKALFVDTVTEICKKDYNPEQIEAWVSGVRQNTNPERWEKVVTNQIVLLAELKNELVGFITLDKGNYIDFLYVHKDHQRQRIADKLYAAIEQEAISQNQVTLISDVSKTARPFFEKVGFRVIKEQTVVRQDVELTNFRMEKGIG